MIEFPRSLARQLWAVLRRCAPKPRGPRSAHVEFAAGARGLRARVSFHEVAVEFNRPGDFPAESLCVPLEALADFEGRGEDAVTLEAGGDGQVVARWQDRGVPQAVEYQAREGGKVPAFPEPPARLTPNPPGLLAALDEAARTAAQDGVRYAVQRLQLKGRAGEVVATDGRQLLVQGGFEFPWAEDVLVPRVAAFGCRELGRDAPVEVGRTKDHVALRVGPWALFLRIDADARYPRVEDVIPKLSAAGTHWRIAPEDALFLARVLPRLPGQEDENGPVTVDLGGGVFVRARESGQGRATEVVLARSDFTGKPVRFCVNRQYLARALQLGFAEAHVVNADTPLLFQDNGRTYVAMPLPKDACVAPSPDALRLASADGERPRKTPNPERKRAAMPTPTPNGAGNGHGAAPRKRATEPPADGHGGAASVIAEAQALRDALRETYRRASRLVAALKRQRKQSRLVQSTIASLRQLQQIDS